MSVINLEIDNSIAIVTLNRPEALNAMNAELREAMIETWKRVSEDDGIRLAVLTGTGKAFCAGLDIKEAASRVRGGGRAAPDEARMATAPYSVWNCPKPVIAAVNSAGPPAPLPISSSSLDESSPNHRQNARCSSAVSHEFWPMSSPKASRRIDANSSSANRP